MINRRGGKGGDGIEAAFAFVNVHLFHRLGHGAIGGVDFAGHVAQRIDPGAQQVIRAELDEPQVDRVEEGPRKGTRLAGSALGADIMGKRMLGKAVLLTVWRGGGTRAGDRCDPVLGQLPVAGKVFNEQTHIHSGRKVRDARAEARLADMACTRILFAGFQIVDR